MRAPDLRSPRRRVRVAQVAFVALFAALVTRAAYLCLDERGERRGDRQLLTAISVAPERGRIYDRDGEVLALTVPAPSLYALPAEVDDPARSARSLARIVGTKASVLRRRMERAGAFVFLRRWISEDAARKIEALGLRGIGIVREPRRAYPLGPVAGPFLGFANIDGEGVRGVERLEDTWLAGRRVRVAVERDARGKLLIGPGLDPEQSAGGDIAVTLDAAMQAHAEVALAEAVRRFDARGGFVITLDPRSGDILALAEWPRFDPNRFRDVPFGDTRSRAFLDALEPGSTLKAFLAAAALDSGAVAPGEALDLAGGVKVPGKWIRDRVERPQLDLAGILRVSSNAGAVRVAQRLGPAEHHAALLRFGFGRGTGSGFPEESSGLLRPWDRWRPIDHATVAFGQGVSVTPIQLAAATAALAGDGRWRAPRLVRARRRAHETWTPVPNAPARVAVSAASAKLTRDMLVAVTERGGTGARAALEGVRVGGKTGTAQKFDVEAGRYSEDAMIAWFAGFAPAADPRLAIVVGLDEAQGEAHSGGEVAAPLFAEVAAAHLTHLGLPTQPIDSWDSPRRTPAPVRVAASPPPEARSTRTERSDSPPPAPVAAPPPAKRKADAVASARPPADPEVSTSIGWIRVGERIFLPDLRGLGADEVGRLAAEVSLHVVVEGEGRVVAQDPPAGTILAAGDTSLRVRCATRRPSANATGGTP